MGVTYVAKEAGKGEWVKTLLPLEEYAPADRTVSYTKPIKETIVTQVGKYTYSGKNNMVKTWVPGKTEEKIIGYESTDPNKKADYTKGVKVEVPNVQVTEEKTTPAYSYAGKNTSSSTSHTPATTQTKIVTLYPPFSIAADVYDADLKKDEDAKEANKIKETTNKPRIELNNKTEEVYAKIVGTPDKPGLALKANGENYVALRDVIRNDPSIDKDLETQFRSFYVNEKIEKWDPTKNVTRKPPYGDFDYAYYAKENPEIKNKWDNYENIDDVDVVERYGEAGFYANHYSTQGKAAGLRGNALEAAKEVEKYREYEPKKTNVELEDIRDKQLGLDTTTQSSRLMKEGSAIKVEWDKAIKGDPYWKKQAKEKYLDIDKQDEFLTLFRLSERPEDKEILKKAIGTEGGITELEDAFNQAVGAEALVETKKFGALAQDVLKETIAEMKKAKEKEQMLDLYKGLGGFSEIMDINKQLSNSILGDSGVGGILSQMRSTTETEEDLEKKLENITGVRNNVVYNWEKWFDETLKTKYGIDYSEFEPLEEKKDIIKAFTNDKLKESPFDVKNKQFNDAFLKSAGFDSSAALTEFLEKQGEDGLKILNIIKGAPVKESKSELKPLLEKIEADIKILDATKDRTITASYTAGDKTESLNIEAQFARNFIDEYLKPRFDTSRSMDEFREYIDVRQEEQNPFQTQDIMNAVKQLADIRVGKYLADVQNLPEREFDSDFYFDPKGDASRESAYAEQAATVAADWNTAKTNPSALVDPKREALGTWEGQAYRFGLDLNDKKDFAKLHFQLIGNLPKDPNDPIKEPRFDGAEDVINASKVRDEIYKNILPALSKKAKDLGSVFGIFTTPEEFADDVLEGVDPTNKEAWDKVLKANGLEDFKGTIDELKEEIKEALRTGSAQTIRENIKYLNEKRERPTQEKLGITYIERPEDYKTDDPKSNTALYTTFQKAGYKGTEDEFYEKFFPDTDRSEQEYLTKALTGADFKMNKLTLSDDPFENFNTIQGMFPEEEEEDNKKDDDKIKPPSQFFRLGLEDDEEDEDYDYKSKSGSGFLSEFTKNFK